MLYYRSEEQKREFLGRDDPRRVRECFAVGFLLLLGEGAMSDQLNKYSVVITTTNGEEAAAALARSILDAKLGACVQVQSIKSFYKWKGEQCNEPECLLLIKTRHELYGPLVAHIKANHSYETPEIIEVPIIQGSSEYLQWIQDSTI
jgi:periplasmic divalent cation tolerance protein